MKSENRLNRSHRRVLPAHGQALGFRESKFKKGVESMKRSMKRGGKTLKIVSLILLLLGLVLLTQSSVVLIAGPAAGNHQGQITVTAPGAANSALIPVTLTIAQPPPCQAVSVKTLADCIAEFNKGNVNWVLINPGEYDLSQMPGDKKFLEIKPEKPETLVAGILEARHCETPPIIKAAEGQEAIAILGVRDKEMGVTLKCLIITNGGAKVGAVDIVDTAKVSIIGSHIKGNKGFGIAINNSSLDSAVVILSDSSPDYEHETSITNNACGIKMDDNKTRIRGIKKDEKKTRIANGTNGDQNTCGTYKANASRDLEAIRNPQIKILHPQDPQNREFGGLISDFSTIQEAIDAAVEGDTISVAKGPCVEKGGVKVVEPYLLQQPLSITKGLTLQGEDRDCTMLLARQSDQPVIDITGTGIAVNVKGITIEGARKAAAGIRVTDSDIIKAEGIKVRNAWVGIELKGNIQKAEIKAELVEGERGKKIPIPSIIESNQNEGIKIIGNVQQVDISSSKITSNGSSGIFIQSQGDIRSNVLLTVNGGFISGNGGAGIATDDTAAAQININILEEEEAKIGDCDSQETGNKGDGISLNGSSKANVNLSCIGKNEGSGISLSGKAEAMVDRSVIFKNKQNGIVLKDSARASITAGSIVNNTKNGIHVKDCAQVTIETNMIFQNEQNGLLLEASTDCSRNSQKMQATINSNKILNNKLWGVAAFINPCFLTQEAKLRFKDIKDKVQVTGKLNEMSGNGVQLLEERAAGDPGGNICPREWVFLIKR